MKKILSLFFPTWSADLLARTRKEKGVVLLTEERRGKVFVARCCKTALHLGIAPGMELVRARALCPQAEVVPFHREEEEHALKALAQWALRFSPIVAMESPGEEGSIYSIGIHLDMTGSDRVFRGAIALMSRVQAELRTLSLTSRMAIAPSLGGAWALSRYAPCNFLAVDSRSLTQTIAPLPVAALRLPSATLTALEEVGIKTVAHLLHLPRHTLLPRFGAELVNRLEQALGKEEPLSPEHPPTILRGEKFFTAPLFSREALRECTHRLLRRVLERLDARLEALSSAKLEVFLANRTVFTRLLPLSLPTTDEKHLLRLLDSRLESVPLDVGIDGVSLVAERTSQQRGVTRDAFSGEPPNTKELGKLLDTLALRKEHLLRLTPFASHVPERAFGYRPFHSATPRHSSAAPAPTNALITGAERPSLLFPVPQPITAMALLPDKPPRWLQWQGETFAIKKGLGPERILEEWWRAEGSEAPRDYFTVQLESGLWVWIFRQEERWFLHGVWS